jgi:UDP-3-O-[3-hydroxymyristoyl] glucosamine N-acyltransferase
MPEELLITATSSTGLEVGDFVQIGKAMMVVRKINNSGTFTVSPPTRFERLKATLRELWAKIRRRR